MPLQKKPIAVTVFKAQTYRLRREAHLTGSVMPWKKENLRFEVPGKVSHLRILTPGKQVRGVLKNEFGEAIYRGDVIAMLDPTPYRLSLRQAEALLKMAEIKLEASRYSKKIACIRGWVAMRALDMAKREIREIFPLNEKIIQEQFNLATTIHENTKLAYKSEDATNIKMAEAISNLRIAEAEREKYGKQKQLKEKELENYRAELYRAVIELKFQKAEEKIADAEVKSAKATVDRAKQDADKCTLRASFDGVISEIYINPGAVVDPSVPIATLVMMDPVRVDMAVSFKKLRDFHFGNEVRVYAPQEKERYEKGYVYHIQTTADPATRTFLAIIAVRNRLFDLDSEFLSSQREYKEYQSIKNFSGVVHRNPDGSGPLYVDVRCIQRDEKGSFVWKVAKRPEYYFNPEASIRKVYLKLGSDYINVITWLFRELKDSADLTQDDILLIRPSLLTVDHLPNPIKIAGRLKNGKDAISQFLREQFSTYGQKALENYDGASPVDETLTQILVDELNQVLQGDPIYEKERFQSIRLPDDILGLVKYSPQGENLIYLNRVLLEHAYPEEIVKSHAEFQSDQKIIQLRQDWLFHPEELVEVEYDRELPEGIYLPSEAIIKSRHTKDNVFYVFVVKDTRIEDGYEIGIAEMRQVYKRKAEDLWSIKNVEPGERVIIHGAYAVNNRYESLKDKIPVTVIREEENLADLIKGYTIISSPK